MVNKNESNSIKISGGSVGGSVISGQVSGNVSSKVEGSVSSHNPEISQTENITFNQQGSNIAGGVAGKNYGNMVETQNNYAPEQKQSLAKAAAEIREVLVELEKSYPTNTTAEKMTVAAKAIEQIERDPTFKQRVTNAAKEGGLKALEKAIDNPFGAFIVGAVEGWQGAEGK